MKYCGYCGKQCADNAAGCPECGYVFEDQRRAYAQTVQPKEEDKNSAGFNVLSFFIPIVGLILYLVWMDEYPIRAKGCGKWALISVIVDVVVGFLAFIFSIFLWIVIFGFSVAY